VRQIIALDASSADRSHRSTRTASIVAPDRFRTTDVRFSALTA